MQIHIWEPKRQDDPAHFVARFEARLRCRPKKGCKGSEQRPYIITIQSKRGIVTHQVLASTGGPFEPIEHHESKAHVVSGLQIILDSSIIQERDNNAQQNTLVNLG